MGIHDPERDDNLRIEVSSLKPPALKESDGDSAGSVEGRPLFAPTRWRHAQRRRGILVIGVLVATLVALTLTITPTRDGLLGAMFGPTPTATMPVPAGEDNLYISITPNWGHVTLDNKPLTYLPVEGIDQPIDLARGVHELRWRFAPIIDISCRLSVPTRLGDNCPLRAGITPGKKGIASVVTWQLSLTNLAPEYRSSLLSAITGALDTRQSSEIVRAGESYLRYTTHGLSLVMATQPLRATLGFVSDAGNMQAQCPAISSGPGANCALNGDCREICTAPWQSTSVSPGAEWQAYIVAHAEWRYATLDGRVVADHLPDAGGQIQALGSDELPVPIAIRWDGSNWHVGAFVGVQNELAPIPDLVCASPWAEIQNDFLAPPTSAGWGVVTSTYIPGAPPATGCLVVLTQPGQGPLLLLQRFGVLLAVNDAARHSLGRILPMANAYEQEIARQLAQRLPELARPGQ